MMDTIQTLGHGTMMDGIITITHPLPLAAAVIIVHAARLHMHPKLKNLVLLQSPLTVRLVRLVVLVTAPTLGMMMLGEMMLGEMMHGEMMGINPHFRRLNWPIIMIIAMVEAVVVS